jgi:hypothetical protein
MPPELYGIIGIIIALVLGGSAHFNQRRKGLDKINEGEGDLDVLRRRNEEMASDLSLLRNRIVSLEDQRASLENSFQRQVATLLAELTETRTTLENTRFELSAAMDELDRLRRRLDTDHATRNLTPARRIRVLGIWPETDADPLTQESTALNNAGISYESLIGKVNRRDILRELHRAQGQAGYNVIHIGSHAQATDPDKNQAGGILLSSGDLVPPSWWGQIAETYGIQVAVLMTCEGDDVADAMRRRGVAGVVAAQSGLGDKSAVNFSFALYENLAEGMKLGEAVKQATWVLTGEQAQMIRMMGDDPWK